VELHACRVYYGIAINITCYKEFGLLPVKKSLERFCKSGMIGRDDINS
jgi:hypothetical protein